MAFENLQKFLSLSKKLAELNHIKQSIKEEVKLRKETKEKLAGYLEGQKIIQAAAQSVQQKAHKQIAKVVTKCLRSVGWDYDFKINFIRKRGKTEAKLVFVRNGVELDALKEAGGGPADIASFALRIACLILSTPKRRKLLVLDEPFKNVHGKIYRERTKQLLEMMSRELGFQLVIATGLEWLEMGNIVRIE